MRTKTTVLTASSALAAVSIACKYVAHSYAFLPATAPQDLHLYGQFGIESCEGSKEEHEKAFESIP